MKFLTTSTRLTIGLVGLSLSVWLIAWTLGLVPNRREAVIAGRVALSENVAVACSQLATRGDNKAIDNQLRSVVERNPDVLSAAIRKVDGSLMSQVGDHPKYWSLPADGKSSDSQMRVPIVAGSDQWGTAEVRFQELSAKSFFSQPIVRLVVFVAAASYLLYFIYLRKMLRHLNPSKVIPPRVRATLDALAEGLLVMDNDERILLANRSFATAIGAKAEQLTGRKASELPWESQGKPTKVASYPWMRAMNDGSPHVGDLLTIGSANERRVLKVGATPIVGDDGVQRGALASFDDVTLMEKNRSELREMLAALSQSRDEIHRQNVELERLATRDPLTTCLNRRAFFSELETLWSAASRQQQSIACIMIDLDHFKSINDAHGHGTGDLVLQTAAKVLLSSSRDDDLVCRYGGEEFCVLLPHTDMDGASRIAERIRGAIESTHFEKLSVTASLGVSAIEMGARDPQGMIDQADQCLYVAKRDGRNCVARYDECAEQIDVFKQHIHTNTRDDNTVCTSTEHSIPFHAVTALVSALAYRDAATADHSRRVADLCVATAQGLMSVSESFILETAALLHDIGKIGVPDSILLKPGKLSNEEWSVMNSHERIGVEIIQSTFSDPRLGDIVCTYRGWYGGSETHPQLPTRNDIPLAARILAIADAFDAMTADQSYRKAFTHKQAFDELRRCANKQFDANLVERFISIVSAHDDIHSNENASSASAISFGTQIERLADAMNTQDLEGIPVLARRLRMTALKYAANDVADLAQQLEDAAQSETDVKQLVHLLNELLTLCRGAQRTYLEKRNDRNATVSSLAPATNKESAAHC